MRQGNRQGWWKRSTFREKKGRQLTLNKTVGSRVWWHTQGLSEWKVSVRSKVGIVFKKSRYRLGHRPVVTPREGDGSRYSQAHLRVTETVPERSRPWSWSLKKCLREADGPTKDARGKKQKSARGWKDVRPGVRLDGQSFVLVRSPKNTSVKELFQGSILPFGSLVEYHPIFTEDQVANPSIWEESTS